MEKRDFGVVVRDELIRQGRVTALGNPNYTAFVKDVEGVSYEALRKALTRDRWPGPKVMEAVGAALGIAPEGFWEYRLWNAQRQLDPREVGEDEAFASLCRWEQELSA